MSILILAATSEIARENARIFLDRGEKLLLAARRPEALENWGENTAPVVFDAYENCKDFPTAEAFFDRCREISNEKWGEKVRGVYIAQGFLPHADRECWKTEIETSIFLNFTSVALFLEAVARYFEQDAGSGQKRWIAVIASVAGDRGRPSNYPYGAAKAGLDAYLSGLRARLFARKISVLSIKPGLVRTKMIAGRPQEKSFTAASPVRVAKSIDRAIRAGRDTLYVPWFWQIIMLCVRLIPSSIFNRMRS